MPNWCSSAIKFYSENENEVKEMLKRFVEIFNGEPAVENGFGHGWMGDYAHAFFPEVELEKIRCRGSVELEDAICKNGKYFYFTMFTETAWSPLMGLWHGIVEKFYKDVKIAYVSEETGMGVFSKWDESGVFFLEELYFDICFPTKDGETCQIDDHYMFGSLDDIYKWLDENFSFKYEKKGSIEELEEELNEILHNKEECKDDYFYCQIGRYYDVHPAEYEMYHREAE